MTVYGCCKRLIIAPTIWLGITRDSDPDIIIWIG